MKRIRLGQSIALIGFAGLLITLLSRPGRADAPPGRYNLASGIILDTKTNLTWQGTIGATKYALAGAVPYCSSLALGGGGWRLPSENELQTLVDESRTAPAIDPSAFPGTPAEFFWTSSTVPSFSNFAWAVTFNDGVTSLLDTTQPQWVRCVR